jgi:uncharacterized C2H2 Zn-finger protein
MRLEETMREAQHADGEPLIYFRCVNCGSIFSRLTSKPTVILAGAH